ncbi:hypothetical protein BZZ01_19795 [Nostocales cyanobacterium HT-58-2]|nr:hypothetical protein BZZ01_19795 [Nostocales cyanobacterium HT-58-2]
MVLQFGLSKCKYSIHLAEILALLRFTYDKKGILIAKILVSFCFFTVNKLNFLLVDVEKEGKNGVERLFSA